VTTERILIAGIGNIFLGDDAFGVEVVQRLARRPLPDGVRVVDFGIRGLDLAYALLDEREAVILVDALPRGGPPGTLYVIEPVLEEAGDAAPPGMIEPHALTPDKVLRLARSQGANVKNVLVVGCEPGPMPEEDDLQMEMSEPVRASLDEAVRLVESLVSRLLERP
jgi:hydrogenase maturation protease